MFCPKCGSLLLPKKHKKVLACTCGYTNKEKISIRLSEKIDQKEELQVMDEKDDLKALPLTESECPKCKHGKARYWTTQTRAADEAETKFLRCEKCYHVWREYD